MLTDNSSIEKAKSAQFDLLIELKRICIKNEISYFLVGGTLIGAIRHGGFIPWDDDIDVGMLRNDYEKFIEVCERELCDEYELKDWHNDVESPLPFLKMKIKNTHYTEKLSENSKTDDGIFIDIFPFDNAPGGLVAQKFQAVRSILIKKILLLKKGFNISEQVSVVKKIMYFLLKIVAFLKTTESWKILYEKNASKYNTNTDSKYVVSLGGSYSYRKELKERTLVSTYTEHVFEKEYFSIPLNYDKFLRDVYGDYMVLPKEDEQVSRHGILNVDLGTYRIKNIR